MNYKKLLLNILILVLVLSTFISGCALPGSKRRDVPKIDIIIENPLQVKRTDEFVVLKVADLKEVAPNFSQNAFIVLQADSGKEIPHQLDDMNNDGEGDEIAMIMDMEPGEKKRIVIRYSPESPESRSVTLGHKKRTRTAIHPEYEGVGWESELVAYRVYPDHRNSISIFGKQQLGLSLDKFASSTTESATRGYESLEPWGVSILEGGDSVGCGGFGLWYENKLVKPGSETSRYMRIVADGPIRSVAQVIFDKWSIGDQKLRVTATYAIFAGQRWSGSEIKIVGADMPVKIVSGLAKSKTATLIRDEKNGLFYTWGAQSRLNDDLGLALIYPTENFDSFHEDSGSYMVVLNPGADNEITYWFLSAWSRGEIGIKNDAEFPKLVSSVMQNIRHPLTATIMPVKLDQSGSGRS